MWSCACSSPARRSRCADPSREYSFQKKTSRVRLHRRGQRTTVGACLGGVAATRSALPVATCHKVYPLHCARQSIRVPLVTFATAFFRHRAGSSCVSPDTSNLCLLVTSGGHPARWAGLAISFAAFYRVLARPIYPRCGFLVRKVTVPVTGSLLVIPRAGRVWSSASRA